MSFWNKLQPEPKRPSRAQVRASVTVSSVMLTVSSALGSASTSLSAEQADELAKDLQLHARQLRAINGVILGPTKTEIKR